MTEHIRIAIIIGSNREGRYAPTIAKWFVNEVRKHDGLMLDIIDLAEISLPAILPLKNDSATAAYAERIGAADAFVMITPEYNHSYPASLKQAIDLANAEWHAKPVAFVSYGGMSGGIRAVEHLRTVISEVHGMTIRNTISLHNVWRQFDSNGNLIDPSGGTKAADALVVQLIWWARALRNARIDQPYAA
jgi:NAD(P)H-dependent FMN reductase